MEFLRIEDAEVLELFYEYLRSRWEGKKVLAEELSEESLNLAEIIVEAGTVRGTRREDQVSVDIKQVATHMEQNGIDPKTLEEGLLLELKKAGVLKIEKKQTATSHTTVTRELLTFDSKGIPLLVKQGNWLTVFETDICNSL